MNIEQIAVGIKDAHGLDMSDEAAITLLRHALSKLAEQAGSGPVALLPIGATVTPSIRSTCGVNCITEKEARTYAPESVLRLYTEAQLIAAQQRTAEVCARVCENLPHKFRTEFSKVSSECAAAIRNNWREYL